MSDPSVLKDSALQQSLRLILNFKKSGRVDLNTPTSLHVTVEALPIELRPVKLVGRVGLEPTYIPWILHHRDRPNL